MLALVIDEFQDLPRGLPAVLRDEGYVLEAARSRGEALWLLEESGFDAVLYCAAQLDAGVAKAVASTRAITQAPLLVVADEGAAANRIAVLDAGADDVVMAPNAHEVAARLRALARRPAALSPQELVRGSLRLDLTSHRAYREGEEDPIDLTAREFSVLEVMMRHPKTVLTRTRLVEHVWGIGAYGNSNVVDQLVSRLRAKLRHFGVNEIMTVRGVGYRFEPAELVSCDKAS